MRTEASGKFEKGLDPNTALFAINRACQLVEECGAGEVVGGIIDVYPNPKTGNRVAFEPEKINRLLGIDISAEEMIGYLKLVDLEYDKETNEIIVPSWRQDIKCMNDLAEEVARFYGYDVIPTTLPNGEATTGKLSFKLRVEASARNIVEDYGFSQGMTYSFESPKVFDKLLVAKDSPLRQTIVITNPLGEDYSIMRTTPLNGMLTSLSTNFNRRNKNVRLYELANIYLPKALPLTELPDERMQLTLGMYGEGDFFTMKGVVEHLFEGFGMYDKVVCDPDCDRPFLHPGRKADIIYKGVCLGYMGEVHPVVCDNYAIKDRVYVAVIDMPSMIEFVNYDRKYSGIAKYPGVARDISLVVPKHVMAGQIEDVIEKCGGAYLEGYELFDLYEGAQIQIGFKSMAYTVRFRAQDKTLEEADITTAMNRIMKGLAEIGVELRQ
jgi:phenylalanyl-tRNA synthetase beta chain